MGNKTIEIINKRKGLELKKHVAAIHSGSKLTLVQRKIANALLFNAYDNLLENTEHRIHIEDLCELIGYNSKDYNLVRRALKALLSTVIEWNLVDKENLDSAAIWNASAIISDASTDGPICTYSYSNKMKQLLYHPEVYGRVNMDILRGFKSTYGLALYENCVRYQNIHQTPWFEIDLFRKLMGVEEGSYTIFRDFKRRVIDKAIGEINKLTTLDVYLDLKRINRKVSHLKFKIVNKKDKTIDNQQDNTLVLTDKLKLDFGVNNKQIFDMMKSYDEHYISEKIYLIQNSNSYKEGKIKNLAQYLINALEHDYQAPKSSKDIIKKRCIRKKENNKKYLKDYNSQVRKQFVLGYQSLIGKEKVKLERQFEDFISNGLYHNIFLKEGLENPLVIDQLCVFLRRTKNTILLNIISYEEFCNSQSEKV